MNSDSDNDIECIVCQDNTITSPYVKYQHTCGIYDIHQICLDNWFLENSHNCIICRSNILNSPSNSENSYSSTSIENSSNSESDRNYDGDTETNSIISVQNLDYTNQINNQEFEIIQHTDRCDKFLCIIMYVIALALIFFILSIIL